MQITDFKAIVSAFGDPGSEILFDKSKVLISVNGDLLDVAIRTQHGDVYVDDGNEEVPASHWILTRLAKLPLLATRLKDAVGDTKTFVPPTASLLPSLEVRPDDVAVHTNNALTTMLEALDAKSPLETTILYITSDAGEGKTFLINEMAKEQARRFSEKKADWLLVPIPLGGKHFLRFDDITVGALQNRYRFPFLYYESFLALVRMGVIVPAFDGFEEMFVENSSGEALSAMGVLVSALDSRGSLVIAARKAYFEFENLKTQERLFDSISSYSVGFGKLELERWGRAQFLAYCAKREVPNGDLIFDKVSGRLGQSHSLLTRPVLVRRLVDIAVNSPTLDAFLEGIQASGPDFFSTFVRGIIDREANDKWIDRSGERDVGTPLLSVDEHCELLSSIALATWESRVDFLKLDYLEFVTDDFIERKRKNSLEAQQIRERIRGHALLISSPNASKAVEFDHEEFRLFFLGEAMAEQIRPLTDKAKGEVLAALRKGILPKPAQHAFIWAIKRHRTFERLQAARFLLEISALDGQASYTHENCGWLFVRLLSEVDAKGLEADGIAFSPDALHSRKLTNIHFKHCFFPPTSMELTVLSGCSFSDCTFGHLRIYDSTLFEGVVFDSCIVDSLSLVDKEIEFWDPVSVRMQLQRLGISFPNEQIPITVVAESPGSVDPELRDLEKLIRYFMRSTHISESVIMMKLGNRAQSFLDDSLPELLNEGILVGIENRGGNTQRRFKFGMTLVAINAAIDIAQGSYRKFIEECARHK